MKMTGAFRPSRLARRGLEANPRAFCEVTAAGLRPAGILWCTVRREEVSGDLCQQALSDILRPPLNSPTKTVFGYEWNTPFTGTASD